MKFKNLEQGETYIALSDIGNIKKNNKVTIDDVRTVGNEVILTISNNNRKSEIIRGDFNDDVEVLSHSIEEVEVTDETLKEQVREFARLSDQIDEISNTLKKLKNRYEELNDVLLPLLEEMEETKEKALEVEDILVTIKRKGYSRMSYAYKEAFEYLFKGVNAQMKKIAQEALDKTAKTSQIASSIAVQKKGINESKITDALSKYWGSFISKLKSYNNKLDNYINEFRKKIESI
jgi:methyl-accepting chemotaxis protein